MKKFWLVVVGAALCVASPSYVVKAQAVPKSDKAELTKPAKIADQAAKPDPTNVPCEPYKDIRTSDLCAQWKAADAASIAAIAGAKSERWAFWTVVVSACATFFSFISVIVVVFALRDGRATAIATMKALNVGRAKLILTDSEITAQIVMADNGEIKSCKMSAYFLWKNFGERPAFDVDTTLEIYTTARHGAERHRISTAEQRQDVGTLVGGDTPPDVERLVIDETDVRAFLSREREMWVNAEAFYRDTLEPEVQFFRELTFSVFDVHLADMEPGKIYFVDLSPSERVGREIQTDTSENPKLGIISGVRKFFSFVSG